MAIEPCYRYRAAVTRVIDGDSYVLNLDLGFRVHVEIEGRVRDLYCPELNEPGGVEAREAAAIVLAGGAIVVESYRDRRSFARWVVDVYVEGVSVAALLIAAGHGTATP